MANDCLYVLHILITCSSDSCENITYDGPEKDGHEPIWIFPNSCHDYDITPNFMFGIRSNISVDFVICKTGMTCLITL